MWTAPDPAYDDRVVDDAALFVGEDGQRGAVGGQRGDVGHGEALDEVDAVAAVQPVTRRTPMPMRRAPPRQRAACADNTRSCVCLVCLHTRAHPRALIDMHRLAQFCPVLRAVLARVRVLVLARVLARVRVCALRT